MHYSQEDSTAETQRGLHSEASSLIRCNFTFNGVAIFFLLYIMFQVFNKYIISFMANNHLMRCELLDPSCKHEN